MKLKIYKIWYDTYDTFNFDIVLIWLEILEKNQKLLVAVHKKTQIVSLD